MKTIEAWGEEKSVSKWLQDERCLPALYSSIVAIRIRRGWRAERALTTPPGKVDMSRKGALHKAFGENKTLAQWSRDARCPVTYEALIERVNGLGYGIERALTKPKAGALLEAWGERKSVAGWVRDPRCVVGYHALYKRVRRMGWAVERALTEVEQ